jgi:hypothetical protein
MRRWSNCRPFDARLNAEDLAEMPILAELKRMTISNA